jgi:hypothetical protein
MVGLALWGLIASVIAPPAGARELPLTVVAFTSPVNRGHAARVDVRTAPGTQCMLLFHYETGGIARNLAMPKRADNKGRVSWRWRVDPKATPGSWPVVVHCTDEFKGNVEQRRLEMPFVVR